ncbi:MAG: RES family NAD+ phosphorylase [Chloroflexota bacterium]|nr:RES family NAD+ phosphorylase [Chloroflexota bacterium]
MPASRRSSPRHPPPPPLRDAARHPLPLTSLAGPWLRIFRVAPGRSPLYFGKACIYRFDDPLGQYGVLYAADQLAGAFIETFGRAVGQHLIAVRELRERHLATVRARRLLQLVDLRGRHLPALGGTGELSTGRDYVRAQQWSRWFYRHPQRPDGLLYPCRHDPEQQAVALFDGTEGELEAQDTGDLLQNALLPELRGVLDRYSFALDPS